MSESVAPDESAPEAGAPDAAAGEVVAAEVVPPENAARQLDTADEVASEIVTPEDAAHELVAAVDAAPAVFAPALADPGLNRRVALSLLLSLLAHLPLLALTFGGDGEGLPGFNLPWLARRVEAPDLRVRLMPAKSPPPAPEAEAVAPLPAKPVAPPAAHAEPPSRPAPPRLAEVARENVLPESPPVKVASVETAPAPPPARVEPRPETVVAPAPEPLVMAQVPPELPSFVVPVAADPALAETPRLESAATTLKAIQEAENAARLKAEQEARAKAEQEARAKAEQEARERRIAEAKLEREKLEAARLEAARQEAARQEASRQEAARQEAARQEAARQEAARQEAARQEAARQEAAKREAARLAEAREAEARREERLRAIGRQLDAEAAQREASSNLPYSVNTVRRARLYGRSDPNEELARYGEAFAQKIQMNMTLDMVRPALRQRYVNPVVTTAVRSNGSVESIHFVVSSGVPALDEAIRRVVRSQEHYPAFPPALAREFDVIEIRRTWHFDVAIRLH